MPKVLADLDQDSPLPKRFLDNRFVEVTELAVSIRRLCELAFQDNDKVPANNKVVRLAIPKSVLVEEVEPLTRDKFPRQFVPRSPFFESLSNRPLIRHPLCSAALQPGLLRIPLRD